MKKQKKRLISVYSPYEEFKEFGLVFENKGGSVYKYTINLITERDRLFLEKRRFFDKKKILADIKKDIDRKNTFFIRNNGVLKAIKLEITDYLSELIDKRINFNMMNLLKNKSEFKYYFFNLLFHVYNDKPKRRLPHIFTVGSDTAITDLHPIAVNISNIVIKGGLDLYLTPELYAKNKSIFKYLTEVSAVNVTAQELATLRKQLNDNDFTVSKIYGFRSKFEKTYYNKVSLDDSVIPDFNVSIKLKTKKDEVVDDAIKNIFETSFYVLDNKTNTSQTTVIPSKDDQRIKTLKNTTPEKIEDHLGGQHIFLKKLIKKVDLKSLTYAYENFFLYDLENIIKPTFTTELQKEFSIYGLINFSGESKKNNKLNLISPQNSLKFQLEIDIYKTELKFELNKVHTKKTFDIVGDHILNLGMLTTKKQKRVGEKRSLGDEIIDSVNVIGIQNIEYSFLNPIHININSDNVIQKLINYKNHRYRFVLQSLLFSSNVLNDTDVIFFVSNGLNNARKVLIKENLESVIGVCYLTEIIDWEIVKGQSKRSQVVFSDSEDLSRQTNHFAFSFVTQNVSDLFNFSVTLVDGANNIIKFPEGERKLPIINFQIQIIK